MTGLGALLEHLAAEGIEHEPVETYSNGVRHVNIVEPDGYTLAFADPPAGPEPGSSVGRGRGLAGRDL